METPAPPIPVAPLPDTIRTVLDDGRAVCIRRIAPSDEPLMRAGIEQMSPRSRYLRFFSGGRVPPDWVIERLLAVDGQSHLAWGALACGEEPGCTGTEAIGAVHAFRSEAAPDCAEFSVAVLDAWHGHGLGRLLTATLLVEAHAQGIAAFHVDTLHENAGAIAFVTALGGRGAGSDGYSRAFRLDVAEALAILRESCDPPGLRAIFGAACG